MCCSLPACPIANETKKVDDDAKSTDETPKRRPGRPPASSKAQPMTPLSPTSPRKQQQLPPGEIPTLDCVDEILECDYSIENK